MASKREIGLIYNTVSLLLMKIAGEYPDYSGARYFEAEGTLEHAQRNKKAWILREVRIKEGMRVLDIGCGWGSMLNEIRAIGGKGIGVTLSTNQASEKRFRCEIDGLE